jgi:hypothetical protein
LTSLVCKPPSSKRGPSYHATILSYFHVFSFGIIVCYVQNLTPVVKYAYGPCFSMGARYYVLINKASSSKGKNPNQISPPQHHLLPPSRVFLAFSFDHMTDADGSRMNLGSPVAPRGQGRPRGSKNKNNTTPATAGSSSAAPVKRRPGRPPRSKNKPKVTGAAPAPSAPTPAAPTAPPRIFSFFCIAMAQCREIQRLPLIFTKFMDGRELREAVLHE